MRSNPFIIVPTLNKAYAVSAFPLWEFFRMFTMLSGNPISSRKGTTFTPLRKKQKVIYTSIYIYRHTHKLLGINFFKTLNPNFV